MYIRKLTSNVKKGVDVELSPKTLIVGPNGSGKSSIINSIELALTQSVSDLRGKKIVKRGGDLISLAPADDDLVCVADYSNGKATSVTVERTKTGAGRPKVKNKLASKLPFLDVLGILTSKPDALKKWVVEQDVGSVSRPLVLDLLDDSALKERYKRLAGTSKKDEIEVIKSVQTKNNDAIKAYRDEIRSTEKAVEKLAASQCAPSEEMLELAKKRESEAYDNLKTCQEKNSQIHNLRYEINRKQDRLRRVVEQLSEHEKELDSILVASNLSQPITEQDEFVVALRNKIIDMAKIHLAMNSQNCMVCLQGNYIDFGKRIQELSGMNKSIEEAITYHNKRASLDKEVSRLRSTAQEIVGSIQQTETDIAKIEQSMSQLKVEDIEQTWKDQTVKVQELKSEANNWCMLQEFRESTPILQAKIDTAKKLDDALKIVLEKLAENSQGTFISSVQAYLPDNYKFCMKVDEGIQIGFEVDGVIREALSGAEWASMIMAMSAACADSTLFNVITPEERAFDPITLYNVMDVLTSCPYQVVITSTVAPAQNVEGWTIINLE